MTILQVAILVLSLFCRVESQGIPSCQQRDNNTLRFLFMTSFGSAFNSSGSVVGVMMALEKINTNTTILPDYTLEYSSIVDSQCNRMVSMTRFFDEIRAECRDFIAVIGSGCSVATEPVASVGHVYGLSQISYGSAADKFIDRQLYRNHFQMYTRESTYLPAIADMIAYYGWSQLAIITQNEVLFTESLVLLRDLFEALNVTILATARLESDENPANFPDIFAENARIYFLNTYEDKARQIICSAYHNGFFGDYYQWIVFGWYNDLWWTLSDDSNPFDCTSAQLYEVLDGAFAIQQFPINEQPDKVVVGDWSYNQFREEYLRRISETEYNSTVAAHIAYDAVWMLAFALDKTIDQIDSNDSGNCSGEPTPLDDWDYTNGTTACLIRSALAVTNFEGLTGYISFNENGTRVDGIVRIYQLRNESLVQVARWVNEYAYINNESNGTLFPAGIPPDGLPIDIVQSFHISLIVIMDLLAAAGLVFSGVCIAFMVIFRKKKVIKITSSNVDYVIVAGVATIFLSIFPRLYPYETALSTTISCSIAAVLGGIGCTLAFSGMLTKVWKIYAIIHDAAMKKSKRRYTIAPKTIRKVHKFTSVRPAVTSLLITVGMVVILVLGFAIPATRPNGVRVIDNEHSPKLDGRGILQVFYVYECFTSTLSMLWVILIYIYFGILQLISLILAIQTRKVNNAIHDSKEVTAIVYITSIILVLAAVSVLALGPYHMAQDAMFTACLIVVGFSMLGLIFGPKMWRLYKDPNGENLKGIDCIADEHDRHSEAETCVAQADQDKIASLQAEVDNLTAKLNKNT